MTPRLIDGHLDLAMNGVKGRDLTLSVDELRKNDPYTNQIATTTFSEMQAAGLRICFGTLFATPGTTRLNGEGYGYTDAAGAKAQALEQIAQYQRWEESGWISILRSRADVAAHLAQENAPLGVVILMEGADPIRDADDLPFWVGQGVRLIGPAWQRTRFAGGTDTPGPLTPAGRELVQAMKELGVPLDASHLDDASFWDAVEIGPRIIATHSNSRAFLGGNRHLTDQMAQAIADADGVIGLVYLSLFIQPDWKNGDPRTPLTELLRHAQHYASLIGWDRVALGTDMDGGFGAEKTPDGIDSYADVPRFLELIPAEYRQQVASGNWERWLMKYL